MGYRISWTWVQILAQHLKWFLESVVPLMSFFPKMEEKLKGSKL